MSFIPKRLSIQKCNFYKITGQCTDSFHLATSKTADEYECLQKCKDLADCKWFTFYRSLGLCESWKNCVTIDAEGCEDCTLGQRECKFPKPPLCYVPGNTFAKIVVCGLIPQNIH